MKKKQATVGKIDFSIEALQGEPADPSPAATEAIDRALEQVRGGAATVVVTGRTEHQCQVELIPLFVAKANAVGLIVEHAGVGRLRIGESEVFFEPLYLALSPRKPR
jgi:hypothetical protein